RAAPTPDRAEGAKRACSVGAPTASEFKEAQDNFAAIREVIRSSAAAVTQIDAQRATEKSKTPPDQAKIKQLQDSKLAGLRAVYDVIKNDNKLKPLLRKIPEEFPDEKAELQELLTKLDEKPED